MTQRAMHLTINSRITPSATGFGTIPYLLSQVTTSISPHVTVITVIFAVGSSKLPWPSRGKRIFFYFFAWVYPFFIRIQQ